MKNQTRSQLSFASVLLVSAALAAACARDNSPPDTGKSGAALPRPQFSPADSALIRSGESALRQFLDASREGSDSRDKLTALTACDDGGSSYFPTTLLAGYSILASDLRGDTVIARASVVTVAEQDVDRRGGGFVARQRIREDVLEWDVIPVDDNNWIVCNGIRFGYFGADSLTVWRPDGTSYQSARALVDSIARARFN